MAYGLLVKKTSTCKVLDIDYLDETSQSKIRNLTEKEGLTEEQALQEIQNILNSVDYLTKEEMGKVFAGGFIRDKLIQIRSTEAPEKWDNRSRKNAIKNVIKSHYDQFGAYRGNVGHRLVFSMSEELQERVEKAGLNLDYILGSEVKKVMASFQKNFHYGDKIGYSWGIHHDTDNRHIHVFLCNRTESGDHVAFSNPLKGRSSDRRQKDQMGFVKEQVIKAQARIVKLVEKAENDITQVPYNAVSISTRTKRENQQSMIQVRAQDDGVLFAKQKRVEELRKEFEGKREKAREGYARWIAVKESLSRGYSSIKDINNELTPLYEELKRTKTVVPHSFIRKYIFPRGPLGSFARMVHRMATAQRREHREQLLQSINIKKHSRAEISKSIGELARMRYEFKGFFDHAREDREKASQAFYKELQNFRRESEHKEVADFLNRSGSRELVSRYLSSLRAIKEKNSKGIAPTEERKFIKQLLVLSREARSRPVQENQRIRQFLASEAGRKVANERAAEKRKGMRV